MRSDIDGTELQDAEGAETLLEDFLSAVSWDDVEESSTEVCNADTDDVE